MPRNREVHEMGDEPLSVAERDRVCAPSRGEVRSRDGALVFYVVLGVHELLWEPVDR